MKSTPYPLRLKLLPAAMAAALLIASSPDAGAATDPKASRFYEDALSRYENKDIPGAIIQLKNALQIDKSMLPVQVLLGTALLANGEVASAEVAFREALRLGVNRAEIVVPMARAFVAQGKHRALLEQPLFQTADLPRRTQVELLLIRASAYSDLGVARGALKTVEEARAIDSGSAGVWLAEVPIRIRERQYREALDAIGRAKTLAPNSAEVSYLAGSVLHVQGDLKGALAGYDQALRFDEKHREARLTRAGLYLDLRRYDDAARDLAEMGRNGVRDPRASYLRALLAERDGNKALVTNSLKEVTELLDPAPAGFVQYRPQLLMLNGLAHFGLREQQKAMPYLESFQRLQPGTPVSKLLAQLYMQDSNPSKAVEVVEAYLKAQPADGQAMVLLASANMALGRNVRAISLMQEALRTQDAPQFRIALGMGLLASGQTDSAVAELDAAFKKDPSQTRTGMTLAATYLRNGQTVKGVQIAKILVQREPTNAFFQDLLGVALGESGDVVASRAAFEQASKIDPAFVTPKLHLARLDLAANKLEAAQGRLEAVLAGNEKDVDALMEMFNLAARRGNADEAQRWIQKATDISGSRDVRPGLALIDFNLRSGLASPALEAAKRLAAKAPDSLVVVVAYARAQLANGDKTGARSTLANATRIADFNTDKQVEIAVLQISAGSLDGAVYSLEKALSARPDSASALALASSLDLSQGDVAKAEKRARQVADQYPKQAIGFNLLGDVAAARNQTAAAIDWHRKAFQVEPSTETMMRVFRAAWAVDGGKTSMGLAESWLKTAPSDSVTRRALGDGYARQGRYAQARRAYEDLLKTAPADAKVLNNLANVMVLMNDPGAVAAAEKALEQSPTDASAIDTLGWTLFLSGNAEALPRALQLLRDARLRDPANPVIRYHLAATLARSGRKAEARSELDMALQAGKGFQYAADAEKLAASLQ